MRIRKAVIAGAIAAAALGGTAATAAPALAASSAQLPSVAHTVGGNLLTNHWLRDGQEIRLLNAHTQRLSNYWVTNVQRNGQSYYVTVWPRIQIATGQQVLYTTSN